MRRALVAAVVPVFVLGLSACGSNSKTVKFDVNAVSVNGKSAFSVGTITVTEGEKVELRVGNLTDRDHGFSIDAFDVHQVIKPAQPQHVTITPKKTGQFTIYCQLHPTHVPSQLVVVG
jgi:nitrosocyanin